MEVKNFIFRATLEGEGVVNFDDNDAKWQVLKYGNPASKEAYKNKNVKIAKSSYTFITEDITEDGELVPRYVRNLKISSNCLRHHIFNVDVRNGRICYNDAILASVISSPEYQLQGYLFTSDSIKSDSIKKKSPVTISDAEETSGAVITPELGSVAGDKSETSLYYTENVGRTAYTFIGAISPKDIEFLSADDFFERRGVKSEWVETDNGLLNLAFKQRYGELPYTLDYCTATGNVFTKHIGEKGLHFSEKYVKELISIFFKKLLSLDISRSKAYAKISRLEVKPVYDAIMDTVDNPKGWITISSEEGVDDFLNNTLIHRFWEHCDDDVKSVQDELLQLELNAKEEKKKKEEEKKNSKKAKASKTTSEE